MRNLPPIPYGALFFAPMEGITDEAFRKTILKLFPEWDYLACDFLRVPSAGRYPSKHLIRHFGKDLFELPSVQDKTLYQILTSHRAFTAEMVKQVNDLEIPWLDVNLGCPSPTVCKNGGGSFLLTDIPALYGLMKKIRENFHGRLTAKIRVGYKETSTFADCISMLNDVGVEAITVHGRTQAQMYKEPAEWSFIKKAVEISKVPIIGNGDVWEAGDINRMLEETGCHAVMVARGALKAPWMAQDYRRGIFKSDPAVTFQRIKSFFSDYRVLLESETYSMRGLLKQSKSVSRFMLEGTPGGEVLRRKLILSQTVPEFFSVIDGL
ncbi:MAG TPA: tRNA-dihydrouridine synthase family protein [Bacteriovoracaceae bacterium]|nr:tRNA-dihydrouridine synthase family protein [Bacteriovoracaceae bacterium]